MIKWLKKIIKEEPIGAAVGEFYCYLFAFIFIAVAIFEIIYYLQHGKF